MKIFEKTSHGIMFLFATCVFLIYNNPNTQEELKNGTYYNITRITGNQRILYMFLQTNINNPFNLGIEELKGTFNFDLLILPVEIDKNNKTNEDITINEATQILDSVTSILSDKQNNNSKVNKPSVLLYKNIEPRIFEQDGQTTFNFKESFEIEQIKNMKTPEYNIELYLNKDISNLVDVNNENKENESTIKPLNFVIYRVSGPKEPAKANKFVWELKNTGNFPDLEIKQFFMSGNKDGIFKITESKQETLTYSGKIKLRPWISNKLEDDGTKNYTSILTKLFDKLNSEHIYKDKIEYLKNAILKYKIKIKHK